MSLDYPRDLMVICQECHIENLVPEYSPGMFPVCNQCREGLIAPNLNETHNEIVCEACNMSLLLLKKTEFKKGESSCRCESQNLTLLASSTIAAEAQKAGAFDFDDEKPSENDGFSWVKPDDSNKVDSDYNQIFDQDLGVE